MDIIRHKKPLNTIEDNRWEIFQQGARQRRFIAIGATTIFAVISLVWSSVWPFLIGEGALWLALKYWVLIKKKR